MSLQLPPLSLKLYTYKKQIKINVSYEMLVSSLFTYKGEMWMNWTGTVIHLSH